jgi:alkanesulfonate monooxygenase SsuD/methylene tetrahydromethanopterin reductase-like flavin-dependent oxidoreductase (luciferase family)
MLEIARQGRPFLMNVQSLETTRQRLELYCRTLREQGMTQDQVARTLDQCWVWRNVFVAETDAEAARIAIPAFTAMQEQRAAMREKIWREQGVSLVPMDNAPAARTQVEHALVHGSPATVAEQLSAVARTGVGGVIMQFRLGPMSWEDTARSLKLFADRVMPEVR